MMKTATIDAYHVRGTRGAMMTRIGPYHVQGARK